MHSCNLLALLSLLFSCDSSTGELNTTEPTYLMVDSTRCRAVSPDVLIWVQGRATSPHLRSMIRETVANEKNWPADIKVMTVFFMGQIKDEKIQDMLEYEFELYRDIVQANFAESYKTVIYKTITGIHYISEYCYGLKLVLKIDDDVVFHPAMVLTKLVPIMTNSTADAASLNQIPSRTTAGYVHVNDSIDRLGEKPDFPYSVGDEILPGRTEYPPFCAGFFVVMSGDVPGLLQPHMSTTPTFWMEDKYLGILQEKAGIRNIDVHSMLDYGYHNFTKENMYNMSIGIIIAQHLPSNLDLHLSQIFHYLDTCGDVEFETIPVAEYSDNAGSIKQTKNYGQNGRKRGLADAMHDLYLYRMQQQRQKRLQHDSNARSQRGQRVKTIQNHGMRMDGLLRGTIPNKRRGMPPGMNQRKRDMRFIRNIGRRIQ